MKDSAALCQDPSSFGSEVSVLGSNLDGKVQIETVSTIVTQTAVGRGVKTHHATHRVWFR